jgi:hypothetical protein
MKKKVAWRIVAKLARDSDFVIAFGLIDRVFVFGLWFVVWICEIENSLAQDIALYG